MFTGIGEFTIHKEFVSSKVAGDIASLTDPALDRILDFAGEVGLVVLLHNDIDMPFAKAGAEPVFLTQMKALLRRHPKTTIIWAHIGLGRVVRPIQGQAATTRRNPNQGDRGGNSFRSDLAPRVLRHMLGRGRQISLATPETTRRTATLIDRYPDRFLFGTDDVAPRDTTQLRVFEMYRPLWALLTPEASEKVRKGNYERLFDAARPGARLGSSQRKIAADHD